MRQRKYDVRMWSGRWEVIVGAHITFEPGHVVFWDGPVIIRALVNNQVSEIKENLQ